MKVDELIALLQGYPQDVPVVVVRGKSSDVIEVTTPAQYGEATAVIIKVD
jgi:hypothetical protein